MTLPRCPLEKLGVIHGILALLQIFAFKLFLFFTKFGHIFSCIKQWKKLDVGQNIPIVFDTNVIKTI